MRATQRPRLRVRLRQPQRLSTQVVIAMVAILVLTMAGGFLVVQWNMRRQFTEQYEHQAQSVAQAFAADPDVARMVTTGRPGGELQQLAMRVRAQTGALFVVVTNSRGIRYTHPNPKLTTPADLAYLEFLLTPASAGSRAPFAP